MSQISIFIYFCVDILTDIIYFVSCKFTNIFAFGIISVVSRH